MSLEPTQRFSNRVENYVKYRPSYPPEILEFIKTQFNLTNKAVIADVGSGTGIFTRLLLDEGYTVYAVEPNEPMRAYAEQDLSDYPAFSSVEGTAEHTNLSANCVDLITCATAFHWFDVAETRTEFKRILKETGAVVLLWNVRNPEADDFAIAYDALLKEYATDYKQVKDQTINNDRLKAFFNNGDFQTYRFQNQQIFDEQGLIGRSLSSSFVPLPGTSSGNLFFKELKVVFDRYQTDGKVSFHYNTMIYTGKA